MRHVIDCIPVQVAPQRNGDVVVGKRVPVRACVYGAQDRERPLRMDAMHEPVEPEAHPAGRRVALLVGGCVLVSSKRIG